MYRNIKENFYKCIINQKNQLVDKKTRSYTIYLYCTILIFIPSFALFFTSYGNYHIYVEYITYIILPFIIYAFMSDIISLFQKTQKSVIIKILYATIGYIAYNISIACAKSAIFNITCANPDGFQASIIFFAGLFLIPIWMSIIFLVLNIILIPSMMIETMFSSLSKKTIARIEKILGKSFNFRKYILNLLWALFLTYGIFFSSSVILQKTLNSNFIKFIIVELSYYPNINKYGKSEKVCNNADIQSNSYIKLLDSNEVSVANFKTHYSIFSNDKITFKTIKCNINKN